MNYEALDPALRQWASKHSLHLQTEHRDDVVRAFSVVGPTGAAYQIWIDPPDGGGTAVHAWDFKRQRYDRNVPVADLTVALDSAFAVVRSWVLRDNDMRGILPDASIRDLIANGGVRLAEPPADAQIQPASLDLRLGPKATRVRASFLPGPDFSVSQKLAQLGLHEFDLTDGAVLETGCVYIAPLLESLALPKSIAASANPKSSTGRLDVFTRVITDGARAFDQMPGGYSGPLYLEVSPRTFPILLRKGSRLSQIRFRRGNAVLDDSALAELHRAEMLASGSPRFMNGLALSIDLEGDAEKLVGYRAKRYTGVVDVDRVGAYDVADFWEPIRRGERAEIVLDPAQFYILVSREAVHVPPGYAAEMVPFDPLVGEFRVHYAGFFDPGFGHGPAGGHGSRAVLEVRSHEVPFILEHGQTIGRLVYEPLASPPEKLYGSALGSNYQAQGLKLSKHFRAPGAAT